MSLLIILLACLQEEDLPVVPDPPLVQSVEKEIVIIGQRREGNILDVPSAVTVITSRQIRESGATNIVEVIQRQPGFFSQGQNKGAYDQIVDLRGFNNGGGNGQRVLVLVDGRKTNRVVSSATDWATISLANIDRIEIVRGPAAALYGDTAMAGVINIITKKGGKETVSRLTSSVGDFDSDLSSFSIVGMKDDTSYNIFGAVERTDGYRDNSSYGSTKIGGRVESFINEDLLAFIKWGHYADRRELPGSISKAEIALFGRKASVPLGFPGDSTASEDYLDAGLEFALGEFGDLTLFINHTDASSTFNSGGFEIYDESNISSLQLKHVVLPEFMDEMLTITTGLDLSYEVGDSDSGFAPSFDESEYRRRLVGIFGHVEARPMDFLYLTLSLRFDRALLELDRDIAPFGWGDQVHRKRALDQWSPHAGMTFKILDELSLYASYGRTFKYPTRDELVGFFATNPDLAPERAHVYETGVRVQSGTWGSGSVTFYRMEVENEIFFDPDFPFATSFGTLFGPWNLCTTPRV